MTKKDLEKLIAEGRNSAAYHSYLLVREKVLAMMEHLPAREQASRYWREELAGFDYMFDAPPLIIQKLRHHCYHLTGLYDNQYRDHHLRAAPKVAQRLRRLKDHDKEKLCVSESPQLGGFGFDIDNGLFNNDTLKFYESMIVLDQGGLLKDFRNPKTRPLVLEIGAGWGGWAYQWKTLFPSMSYVIVDLPGSLLFSATYLMALFPNAKVRFADGSQGSAVLKDAKEYDFIFVPHYLWNDLEMPRPDLLLNMVSFQEMTTDQVEGYIKKARAWGIKRIYSMNRDCSGNNKELSAVSEIIQKYFDVTMDKPAGDMQYSTASVRVSWLRNLLAGKKAGDSRLLYRHIIGICKL